jgi:hypothetical protein
MSRDSLEAIDLIEILTSVEKPGKFRVFKKCGYLIEGRGNRKRLDFEIPPSPAISSRGTRIGSRGFSIPTANDRNENS